MGHPAPRAATGRGRHRGLAYDLWLPGSDPPWPGIVVLHGAGSRKENHADFGRLASGMGWAAVIYDQRGHGDSEGRMSPAALADAGRMARFLAGTDGVDGGRICVRGSSMGGFVAIHAAATESVIRGAIAICPAAESGLIRELRRGNLQMRADAEALVAWLEEHDLRDAVALMGPKPLILMHARGDDVIPAQWSEKLYERAADPRKLVVVPGGHHRTVQHDAELQAMAVRWLERALATS
jgi:fermentation-respiration switch protein FrsA (DUF1100 family)